MRVSSLPHGIRIAQLSVELMTSASRDLLHAVLFTPPAPEGGRFINLTVQASARLPDISLAMDERTMEACSCEDVFPFAPDVWRVISVHEGEEAIDLVGLVNAIATPIYEAGIEMLYISSFASDSILVPSADLGRALDLIEEVLERGQSTTEGESTTDELDAVIRASRRRTDGQGNGPAVHVTVLPPTVQMRFLSIRPEDVPSYCGALVPLLLMIASGSRVFTLTWTDAELSLLLDPAGFELVSGMDGPTVQQNSTKWAVLMVQPAQHTGPVGAEVVPCSRALADTSIPILYSSSFNENYILVPSELTATAVKGLDESSVVLESVEEMRAEALSA